MRMLKFLGAALCLNAPVSAQSFDPSASAESSIPTSPFGLLEQFADKDFIGCYKGKVSEKDWQGEWLGHECVLPLIIRWKTPGLELALHTNPHGSDVTFRRTDQGLSALFRDGSSVPVMIGATGEMSFEINGQRWSYTVEAGRLRWRTTVQKSGGRVKKYADYVFYAPFAEARGAKSLAELTALQPLAPAGPRKPEAVATAVPAPARPVAESSNMTQHDPVAPADTRQWGALGRLAGRNFVEPTQGGFISFRWVQPWIVLEKLQNSGGGGSDEMTYFRLGADGVEWCMNSSMANCSPSLIRGELISEYGSPEGGSALYVRGSNVDWFLGGERLAEYKEVSGDVRVASERAWDAMIERDNERILAERDSGNGPFGASSGPNLYQILRGMADEAGIAADQSQRELDRTISDALGQNRAANTNEQDDSAWSPPDSVSEEPTPVANLSSDSVGEKTARAFIRAGMRLQDKHTRNPVCVSQVFTIRFKAHSDKSRDYPEIHEIMTSKYVQFEAECEKHGPLVAGGTHHAVEGYDSFAVPNPDPANDVVVQVQ